MNSTSYGGSSSLEKKGNRRSNWGYFRVFWQLDEGVFMVVKTTGSEKVGYVDMTPSAEDYPRRVGIITIY